MFCLSCQKIAMKYFVTFLLLRLFSHFFSGSSMIGCCLNLVLTLHGQKVRTIILMQANEPKHCLTWTKTTSFGWTLLDSDLTDVGGTAKHSALL